MSAARRFSSGIRLDVLPERAVGLAPAGAGREDEGHSRISLTQPVVERSQEVDLHPWLDERGVHRFDPNEVEDLANRESDSCSAPQISEAQATSDAATSALNAANTRFSELERRCAELAADVERLTAWAQREQRQMAELRGTAIEALGMVETLLGPDTPYVVRSVLRDLRRAS